MQRSSTLQLLDAYQKIKDTQNNSVSNNELVLSSQRPITIGGGALEQTQAEAYSLLADNQNSMQMPVETLSA